MKATKSIASLKRRCAAAVTILFLGIGALVSGPLHASTPAQTILIVGDSLSAEYGLKRGTGWVALLEKQLISDKKAAKVVNASISGDTTSGGRSRLASLLKTEGEIHFVREAAVSGLDHHEAEFRQVLADGSKDKKLLAWLDQGAKDAGTAAVTHSDLTGDDLASFDRGKAMFHGVAACFGCHSADGAGMPNLGPPLDESEWVSGKPETLVKILLHGLTGPVTVDGETYSPNADMPGLGVNPTITDQTIADIATYIRNEWSNKAPPVSATLVKQQRELSKHRTGRSWTAGELVK